MKFFKSFLVCINLSVIVVYLLVCIVPYINTGKYWYIALPGLIFPLIVFGLMIFILIWAFSRSKWFWVSVAVLLLGFQQLLAVFAFNKVGFQKFKGESALRILQWNVTSWDEFNKEEKGGLSYRNVMLDLVQKQNADILCFQEFLESRNTKMFDKNIPVIKEMGYPYYYFVPTIDEDRNYETGVVIFSKYPIIDSTKISYGEDASAEHLVYADIKVKDKIFRILTTHLQSVRFEENEYQSLSKLKHVDKSGLRDSRTIVSKLKKGYTYRFTQAQMVKQEIEKSPYPVIFCGDLNDVPNSNTYFTIRGKLQDAFLKKGSFLGRTFRFISPTLRIDYILCDKRFLVEQYQRIRVPYSDHYPIETDLNY